MNQKFYCEEELGNYLACSDLPSKCWDYILKVNEESPQVVKYKRFDGQNGGDVTIIAFACSPTCISSCISDLHGEGQRLVSSADLDFDHFKFLSTKSNPSLSIHNLALQLFGSLQAQLCQEKIDTTKPLIITGHSLAGSVASLFTLWLLNNSYRKIEYRKTKFPICLTFGSPLLGDEGLQKAITGRPSWASCFVHVVSTQDPIPGLFLSPHNTTGSESNLKSQYNSYGLYLFCSKSGVACFSEPEVVLELLEIFGSQNPPFDDYGFLLESLKGKAIVRGTHLAGFDNNPLHTGITLQLQTIGIDDTQTQLHNNKLIRKIEEKKEESFKRKAREILLDENLKKMKIGMAYMEWYKKLTRTRGGYYDSYKSSFTNRELSLSKKELVRQQRSLTNRWEDVVNEAKRTDGKSFPFRLLMAGNNYRRMVEPLDIAGYYKSYKQGQKHYLAEGRSEHYILLEKWLNEMPSTANQRTKACSFNEDSCFWAHVEEALDLVTMLSEEKSSRENEELFQKLVKFEKYVMDSINDHILDPEIFLEGSSFTIWWSKYSEKKGSSYDSDLANYMRNKRYETMLKEVMKA